MGAADPLAAIASLADAGRPEQARADLSSLLDGAAPLSVEQTLGAVALCERLGLVAAAVDLLRAHLERAPRDVDAWSRLAELHDELGDVTRATRCRRRARGLLHADANPRPSPLPARPTLAAEQTALAELEFDDADLSRWLELFAGLEDCHARQWYDERRDRGGYSPVRAPLGHAALRRHLDGRETLGVYVLRADATVGFCVLDLDATRHALADAEGNATAVESLARALHDAGLQMTSHLAELGLPHLFVDSGHKGRHAWLFFDDPQPAGRILDLGRTLRAGVGPIDDRLAIEVFPKQARTAGKGLGNLVKMPLGVHRVSGRRAWLLDEAGCVDPHPFARLRTLRRVPTNRVRELVASAPSDVGAPPTAAQPAPGPGPSEPAPPAASWEDLSADPQVRAVLDGCAVLDRLVARALASDPLGHSELLAIRHSLGHLDRGPACVNHLQGSVPGVPPRHALRSKLSGHPASCATLRRRLPGVARKVGCDCEFGRPLPTYAHPLLHAEGARRAVKLRLLEGERPVSGEEGEES